MIGSNVDRIDIQIRNATKSDLEGILAAEQLIWPEGQRASAEAFASRLELFPVGFFVAVTSGEIVAACTSCLMHYDPRDLSQCVSWSSVTNDGLLRPKEQVSNANALYIVSNGIIPEHRRSGLRERLIGAQIELTRSMKLPYLVTGAMLPGYDNYCRTVAEVSAAEYAATMKDGEPVDPTLRKLSRLGLVLPNTNHLIENYYPSPQSRNYGALLVYANRQA